MQTLFCLTASQPILHYVGPYIYLFRPTGQRNRKRQGDTRMFFFSINYSLQLTFARKQVSRLSKAIDAGRPTHVLIMRVSHVTQVRGQGIAYDSTTMQRKRSADAEMAVAFAISYTASRVTTVNARVNSGSVSFKHVNNRQNDRCVAAPRSDVRPTDRPNVIM